MTSLRSVVVMLGLVAAVSRAHADGPNAVTDEAIPASCRTYAWVPADARDDVFGWNQLLSLAACLQDASITPLADPEQLDAMVDAYTRALEIPTTIYAGALEAGPGSVQLRAAYQLGMLHVTLIVRARTAIAGRDRELHARLEDLLSRSTRAAWISFAVIDRAVREEPALDSDAVTTYMVRSARAMLEILPRPADYELVLPELADIAPTSGPPAVDAHDHASARRP
jgi:hypothetical protein